MPDNKPYSIKDFLDTAIFPTDLLQRPEDASPEQPAGIARIDLTGWQAAMLADAMEVALESSIKYDREVVFADDPDGGHVSISTLAATRFVDYFGQLAVVLEALEVYVDGEQEPVAS